MIVAAYLAGVLLVSQLVMGVLARSRWTWQATRTAIVTWQAVGLAWALSLVGVPLAIGLEPYDVAPLRSLPYLARDLASGSPPAPGHLAATSLGLALGALFTAAHATSIGRALRARARHRRLLALVARRDAAAPGALVLDHPAAAAYCLPGLHPTVVVSAGALALLDRAELAAVLSHERAHARERHDLVLLPFTALCRVVEGCLAVAGRRAPRRWARWPRTAYDAVALLIEMRADDRAILEHKAGPLTAALLRFAAAPRASAPAGALGVARVGASGVGGRATASPDEQLTARIQRMGAAGAPLALPTLALGLAALLLTVPICLLT